MLMMLVWYRSGGDQDVAIEEDARWKARSQSIAQWVFFENEGGIRGVASTVNLVPNEAAVIVSRQNIVCAKDFVGCDDGLAEHGLKFLDSLMALQV